MDFGDRLKEIRIKQGLSQEQLAEKIGVSRQAITKWETKRGLPDVENMVILAEIFKITLDELVLQAPGSREGQTGAYESETIYDIDCSKHFDIHMGSAGRISLRSGDDEKIHIRLTSDTVENLSSLYKIKLDEKKNKIDLDCVKQKEISRYESEDSVDVEILLPKDYTHHCEVEASAKELRIEELHLDRLEYDGAAERIYVKNAKGSLEFTGKSDYDITIEGSCTRIDVYQWRAGTVIHLPRSLDQYQVINKGRKCSVYYRKDGELCPYGEQPEGGCSLEEGAGGGLPVLSVSGIRSELILEES